MQLLDGGNQVAGQTTLDLCNGRYPSEALHSARLQVVEYDAAAIYLVNRKTLALAMVREAGYPEGSAHASDLQVGHGIVGWVA